jgi:hypothetical protein
MKRYSENVDLSLLVVFMIASLTSVAEAAEDDSKPAVSETELKYFDITALKYSEEPDLGIPEEYKVPVEAAFALAKMFREGRQDFDTGGEFTDDYIIAYDLANGYYEYGFFYVDPIQGDLDLEYITSHTYYLAEPGEVKITSESPESGTFAWVQSGERAIEYATLASDATYRGFKKRAIKRVYFVPADKRGRFKVRFNCKDGFPDPIGFLRHTMDKIAEEVLGPGEITEITLSSNPDTAHMVVAYQIDEEYIYFEWYCGYNYYLLGDFKSPDFRSTDFYQNRIKSHAEDLDVENNIKEWDEFIEGIYPADKDNNHSY